MPSTQSRATRAQRDRAKPAVGGLVLGVSSLLAVAGGVSPVSAQEPSVVIDCSDTDATPPFELRGTFTGIPDGIQLIAVLKEGDGTSRLVVNGQPVYSGFSGSTSFQVLPVTVAVALYRDTNGNSRWDPDVDETIYRGDGTITACPQSVALTPK